MTSNTGKYIGHPGSSKRLYPDVYRPTRDSHDRNFYATQARPQKRRARDDDDEEPQRTAKKQRHEDVNHATATNSSRAQTTTTANTVNINNSFINTKNVNLATASSQATTNAHTNKPSDKEEGEITDDELAPAAREISKPEATTRRAPKRDHPIVSTSFKIDKHTSQDKALASSDLSLPRKPHHNTTTSSTTSRLPKRKSPAPDQDSEPSTKRARFDPETTGPNTTDARPGRPSLSHNSSPIGHNDTVPALPREDEVFRSGFRVRELEGSESRPARTFAGSDKRDNGPSNTQDDLEDRRKARKLNGDPGRKRGSGRNEVVRVGAPRGKRVVERAAAPLRRTGQAAGKTTASESEYEKPLTEKERKLRAKQKLRKAAARRDAHKQSTSRTSSNSASDSQPTSSSSPNSPPEKSKALVSDGTAAQRRLSSSPNEDSSRDTSSDDYEEPQRLSKAEILKYFKGLR